MIAKKILGILLIIIAVLLSLAIVGQLEAVLGTITALFKLFTEDNDSYQTGRVIGALVYWIIHFALTLVFWYAGLRLIRKKEDIKKEPDVF